jgi:glycerophosphoryl diester phosphodiesterase
MAHSLSLRIKVYTVDLTPDMEHLVGLGIDGIFTNRPDALARVLGRARRA